MEYCHKRLIASLLFAVTATSITGCSSLSETVTNHHYGYRSYDPCKRCGESWVVLPNEWTPVTQSSISEPPESKPKVVVIE